ncbi:hypothetical protein AVEN_242662-1 [Araneus ventricosus]|uniref:Uncharacterized protein n=1 Tax=Araneus ventricosus TaxID=182803 RepID=A0A4Y1ZJU4_ARAVE|nr:hypothetical protein AVEN_242662-1 [Araneus ventricosus]
MSGRGGLAVRSRRQGRRIPDSKPDSTENLPCMWAYCAFNHMLNQTSSRWCGAEVWRGEYQFRCRLHRQTAVQNYEIRYKMHQVVLQNATLMYLN